MPFDWRRDLPMILGSASGLTGGSSAFASRWRQLEEEDRQRKQQALQMQGLTQQQDFARQANTRANQDQMLQTLAAVQKILGDPNIETPEDYQRLEQPLMAIAPKIGLDLGLLQGFRPSQSVLEKREAMRVVKEIESDKYVQKLISDGQDIGNIVWEKPSKDGTMKRRTLNQWREIAASAMPVGPLPKANPDKRGFTEKEITLNGKRMNANYDPDSGNYYAIGDNTHPLVGEIHNYEKPAAVNDAQKEQRTNARIDRVVNSFNSHPIVKEYNETQAQQGILQQLVAGQWGGPGDIASVFAFMKALDPSSVVREGEYATAAKSGNIFAGWAARFNGALSPEGGFLSDRVRQDFLRTINSRMDVKGRQYQNLRKQLVARIDRIKAGAPETGDEALVQYETGGTEPPPPPPSQPSRAEQSRRSVLPPSMRGPQVGERRLFNGQLGEWDGKGWKRVSAP